MVRNLRVRILMQAEKYDEAEKDCRGHAQAILRPGDIVEIRYLLSAVYNANRQLAKSEEQLEMILKTDPTNATVNNDLGYIWADQNKNLDKAEEMIRMAIDLDRRQRQMSRSRERRRRPGQRRLYRQPGLGAVPPRQDRRGVQAAGAGSASAGGGRGSDRVGPSGRCLFPPGTRRQARSAWEKSAHLFEKENRRKMDERHQEVHRKLKVLDTVK